jgi:type IV pilus assembly protein PilA
MRRLDALRARARDDQGFTLIELLVVILIVGILAAAAIPSFLSQKEKAYDAGAKSLVISAQHGAETIAIDNDGEYTTVTPAELHSLEKAIPIEEKTAKEQGQAWVSAAEGTKATYKVTATAYHTGSTYTLERNEAGEIIKTCKAGVGDPSACSGW